MTSFTAYFDESGTHGAPVITVAGYIATSEQWTEFAREWNEILRRECVCLFHMSKFESRRGEFTAERGWTNEKRLQLQTALLDVIKRRISVGVHTSVNLAAYAELMVGWRREHYGTPYTFCVKNCLAQVSLWAQMSSIAAPINYVIEQGAGYNHEISKAFGITFSDENLRSLFRLGSLSFLDKSEAIQFQAADLLAYEAWKSACNAFVVDEGKRRPLRKSFQSLLEAQHLGVYYGREEFIRAHALEESDVEIHLPDGVIRRQVT